MIRRVVASLVVILSLALTAGTARAATVNQRLAALEKAVAQLSEQVATAKDRIAALRLQLSEAKDTIARLQQNSVLALDGKLTLAIPDGRPTALFTGLNVQIVNGTGQTYGAPNGVGNLLIGYDAVRESYDRPECSIGRYTDEGNCQAAGGTWEVSHKSGSHNLVVGDLHNYSKTGGVVFGYRNTVNQDASSVSGGRGNTASGDVSSVSGGWYNTASGNWSSVSGGQGNTASGDFSSVSGGQANTASGGYGSSVSGGGYNTASGQWSSVSGGEGNTASKTSASVSGGYARIATDTFDWIAGGLRQDY